MKKRTFVAAQAAAMVAIFLCGFVSGGAAQRLWGPQPKQAEDIYGGSTPILRIERTLVRDGFAISVDKDKDIVYQPSDEIRDRVLLYNPTRYTLREGRLRATVSPEMDLINFRAISSDQEAWKLEPLSNPRGYQLVYDSPYGLFGKQTVGVDLIFKIKDLAVNVPLSGYHWVMTWVEPGTFPFVRIGSGTRELAIRRALGLMP